MEDSISLIKKSHERCKSYGLKKEKVYPNKIVNNNEFYQLLTKNKQLIEISKAYSNMINATLRNGDFIIILTDNRGCILHIQGNEKVVKEFKKLNLIIGTYMNERSIGTNAMAVALKENKAVQITANEHYVNMFKSLTCSAAPIHDSQGNIIGILNLTGESCKKHEHTLGLVVFAVKAIENEFERIKINKILNETYNYMENIIENTDKGILIVDTYGNIKKLNELAVKILSEEKNSLIDYHIGEIVPDWYNVLEKLEKKDCISREIRFEYIGNSKIILKIKGVKLKKKVVGMLITMTIKKELFKKNNTGAFYNFEDIIGESIIINNIITNCKIIANSPSTVLIEGESGTGKEILAQAIHNYSNRKDKKFVAINCGAIPSNLIESELFGYEEGTFTGGKKGGKIGKFEMANGGTLFLDEIGEMPLALQVNLLRVLQEGRITRLGGEKEVLINVRIIAATNKDLREKIKKDEFREDLYYRLCVIPITLPPLRERKGDINKLIEYFLRIKSFKLNKVTPNLDENLLNKLINYSWPGNIRQLENCIENLVNLGGNMSFDLIEDEIKLNYKSDSPLECKNGCIIQSFNLDKVEKKVIIKALRANKYNISKSSNALGISRNTLYCKIKKYNIEM
ncbi:sigma-54-dependent Fis family transcriptional regulator [Clostridium tarantellae]|uniref:AAA domain-containing protein n=1 Tax=Clostridium tarantellae TaxID=39493 RepID=A0A6I1MLT6_9CLOT|nr:sigma-54-dependent Fis family transcriptional regulator [Clostridium tarantellae]MPQ43703.1 AAA domain-containing protein [Clostridium tarantellae]